MTSRDGSVLGCATTFNQEHLTKMTPQDKRQAEGPLLSNQTIFDEARFKERVDMADMRDIFDKFSAMTLADIAKLPTSVATGMLTRIQWDERRLRDFLSLPDFETALRETDYEFRQELRDMK